MSAVPKTAADPDVVARMALGALRFVDAVTGQSIADGLSVIARVRSKTISAIPSTRGVHIFHQLPSMETVSFWDGVTEPKPDPVTYEFNIEVRDSSRRFFPTAFKTSFPAWPETSPICPGGAVPDKQVPLYSAPWRLPRNDLALIRGTLRVLSNDKPAAWALLRVFRDADDPSAAAPVIEGITGADGEFMLMFPWPKTNPSGLAGPAGPSWIMRIQAWYDIPDAQVPEDALPDGEQQLPSFCSILKQQPIKLLANLNPEIELPPQIMTPGQTLFLRTSGKEVLYLT